MLQIQERIGFAAANTCAGACNTVCAAASQRHMLTNSATTPHMHPQQQTQTRTSPAISTAVLLHNTAQHTCVQIALRAAVTTMFAEQDHNRHPSASTCMHCMYSGHARI
jgi:hypothetical protein